MSNFIDNSRRYFITKTATIGAGIFFLPSLSLTEPIQQKRPDPIEGEIVRKFVGVAHGFKDKEKDLVTVKEMLIEKPGLLNAVWDWGAGDFETGLGGAGHMGSKDIARYLIGQGSRIDIFAAAMLGELDIVKSIIKAVPEAAQSKGPHGISLIKHAKAGGDDSKHVLDYLEGL